MMWVMKETLVVLCWSCMFTSQLVSHLLNHKVAVFYLPEIWLPLQRCHLTYIFERTGRNGGDKHLNGADHIRAACLFIYRLTGRNSFVWKSVTRLWGLAYTTPPPVLNKQWEEERRAELQESRWHLHPQCDRCQNTSCNSTNGEWYTKVGPQIKLQLVLLWPSEGWRRHSRPLTVCSPEVGGAWATFWSNYL